MSFFFSNMKREVKKPKPQAGPRTNVTARMKQSAGALNRLGCKACPLKDCGNKVEPDLPKKKTAIFFLGEAPGAREEKKGVPFIGKEAKILTDLVPDEYENKVAYGHVVMHRPPDDKEPDYVAIECCRSYVTAAIEKARPRLIVGLGIVAQRWVLNNADIIGLRGRIFTVKIGDHVCFFMPTFNPAFVLKSAYDADRPLQSRMGHCFRMDITRAFEFLKSKREPHVVSAAEAKKDIKIFNGHKTSLLGFTELMDEFAALRKAKKLAIDLETYPLRPYSEGASLLTAAISYRLKNGLQQTFAFAVHHPKAGWTKKELEMILDALEEVLANKKVVKVAHNAPFELEWLMHELETDFVDHNSWEDTMVQAHLIDERKGQGKEEDRRPTYQNLNFLCNQYFGLAIKGLFKLNMKDMRKTDIDECLLYNGVDSKYTLQLHEVQSDILKDEGLRDIFKIAKPRSVTVAVMQRLGIGVNQKDNKKFADKLAGEIKEIETTIQGLKVVKQFVKDKGEFNPHSGPQVLSIFKDYLKRDEIRVPKKMAKDENDFSYKVDKGVLDQIDHPLAPAILKLRNRQKLKSTYVDEFTMGSGSLIYPDGKLHTSYNTTFTTSGRLSSDEPNLQNFPKRNDAWVRSQVVPPPGHIILAVDYGQLEWCLACMCCQDKVMIDATWTGYDVHMVWTKKIAKLWPKLVGGKKFLGDPDKMKKARGLVKNKMVFPVIFGATEKSVAGYLGMPDDVTQDIFKEFWRTFTGLERWQKKLMKSYYEEGFVENFFGRRRHYPMTRNEAINHPIQSSAAEIVVDAMNRLSILAMETGQWHLHPRLNIHDDLTFCVPDDDKIIDESIEIIVKEMLLLPFDFVNVPMSVEISMGKNWADLEDIGKFWTNDIGRTDPKRKKSIRID